MIYEFHSKYSRGLDLSIVPSFPNPVECVLYNGELFIHTASLCTESVTVLWTDNNQLVKRYLVTENMKWALQGLTTALLTHPFLYVF